MDALINLGIFVALLCVGYLAGTLAERNHYRRIRRRERASRNFPVFTDNDTKNLSGMQEAFLASGSIVVSVDYFKRFLANLRNLVGGRLSSYESLLDRGRREAMLRMKEDARRRGGHFIVNARLETSAIGNMQNNKNKVTCVEVLAYGTAIRLTNPELLAGKS